MIVRRGVLYVSRSRVLSWSGVQKLGAKEGCQGISGPVTAKRLQQRGFELFVESGGKLKHYRQDMRSLSVRTYRNFVIR